MKTKRSKFSIFATLCIIFLILVVCIYAVKLYYTRNVGLGERAVYDLYDFTDIYELASQDEDLKNICTDDAYKDLTVTNKDKALNTYLKFKKCPVKVKVLRSSYNNNGGYVLYTLDCNAISSERKFLFLFDIEGDKISNPREMECIDFVRDSKTAVDNKVFVPDENVGD